MKTLFLDIDGVLNSHQHFEEVSPNGFTGIQPVHVERLNRIVAEVPDLQIILSSTWREGGLDFVSECLANRGFKGRLHGMTPLRHPDAGHPAHYGYSNRGQEILAFLEFNYCSSYVVLDDDPSAGAAGNFVRTFPYDGLTEELADEVIRRLK